MKRNLLLFSAFMICGFALSFSFAEYSYSESNTDRILYGMCIQKQEHGIIHDCNNIRHSLDNNGNYSNEKTIHNVQSSDIGVILSNTCLTMINHNVTNDCPDYSMIQSTFPDVVVDPKPDIINRIRLITFVTTLDDFKVYPNSTNTNYDSTTNSFDYVMGKSRHVDESCNNATITIQNALVLLGDTINYMTHDCDDEFTNVESIKNGQRMQLQSIMMISNNTNINHGLMM